MAGMRQRLEEDEDTRPFLGYFDKYERQKEKWAYCYRAGCGLNTNMYVEAFFKKLKYSYMKGKKLRRVDECLHILLRLSRDVAFERLRRKFKGNNTFKQSEIHRAHRLSDEMSGDWLQENVTEVIPGTTWRFNDNACNGCELACVRCHYCVHEFKCTCYDNRIKTNMCKHIHAVVKVFCIEGVPRSNEENARIVQDEIEAICNTNDECNVGKQVEKIDMRNPIAMNISHLLDCFSNTDPVPDAVIQGGLKFLEVLRREMPRDTEGNEEIVEEAEDDLDIDEPQEASGAVIPVTPKTPRPTRAAKTPLRTPKTPRHMITPQVQSPGTPKRVSPQRRLFHSVKKKPLKKKQNLHKPTFHQEGAFIANFSMGEGLEFVTVHNEFDHSYTRNNVDDNY
ncbi:hypothetical protein FOCC_FOCC008361 [Frankliniella occidentalis]|uniref:Uncharacterized protein LOC127749753 n=1 Tax=Frankliniella occidentalis TaxID=133901 RepID=A0A9C6TZD1_FRAOC|nr:uncharacterized protein LOC127749753 [Frankliniella occidentalis]KAE8744949.1 hypothetical protein FOCC_FOCC008361 [Frankliniella occidentalis]